MDTVSPKVVNDFKALFMLVCWRNSRQIMIDSGKQQCWEGITAGKFSSNVQFLQTEGINALFDIKHRTLMFSKGSPETLENTLGIALQKSHAVRASQAVA